MKKIILLALLAYFGYTVYEHFEWQESPAFKAYEMFTQALVHNDMQTLKALAQDPELLDLLQTAQAERKKLYAGKKRWHFVRLLTQDQNEGELTCWNCS